MCTRMCNVNMLHITLSNKHWPPQAGQHLLNDDLGFAWPGARLMRENADESKGR